VSDEEMIAESESQFGPSVGRREFLRLAGLLGGGAAVVSALSACGQSGGTAPTGAGAPAGATAGVQAASKSGIKVEKPPDGTGGGKPIVFRGWNYHPEVVEDNVKAYNGEYQENVDYQTISGDYVPLIDKILINKEPLNFAYSVNSSLHKWYRSGWVWDLEGHWNIENYKKDQYPGWRDIATSRDGKLLALPYFQSVRGTICTNEDMLAKAGITEKDWPQTWDALYDQCRQIKKNNITDVPFLPQWYGTFLIRAWGWQAEVENRGGKLFDDKGLPVFDDTSYKVLETARQLVADNIVPKEMFTMQETDFVDAFGTGRYAYSAQQIYDNKVHNDPTKSKIAKPNSKGGSRFLPVYKQTWGFIEAGQYTPIKHEDQKPEEIARAFRLIDWFGYKDKGGNLRVSKRWAIEQALNSGYPATLQDKDVQEAYHKWMPNPDQMLSAMDTLFQAARAFQVQKRAMYDEWNQKATPSLAEGMLGQKPTKQVVDELKQLAIDLHDKNQKSDPD
jgi:multiple sugar transport system substrate-binding protein